MNNTMVEPTDLFAFYKGKKYQLEYIGNTKFGYRAKLTFLDGTDSFWVDASLLSKCKDTESWESVGEDRDSMYSVFDSIYDFDPDLGDH